MPDVTALLLKGDKDDEEDENAPGNDGEEEGEEPEADASQPKPEEPENSPKSRFWYKDGFVAEKEHEMLKAIDDVVAELLTQRKALNKDILERFAVVCACAFARVCCKLVSSLHLCA